MSNLRWDETWHRLREWTQGQAPSERLAAQILLADGFTELDPSHPLGGRDGGKDAVCSKNGVMWIMAVYFPRGQKSFAEIKGKFREDLQKARANQTKGFAFVTNQELSLSERQELRHEGGDIVVEIYHLERIATLLDSPPLNAARRQFLQIDDTEETVVQQIKAGHEELLAAQQRLEHIQTGGTTFCYFMLYHFDMVLEIAQQFAVIKQGEFPLYDLHVRIMDMDTSRDVYQQMWGGLNSVAGFLPARWELRAENYYRAFFSARNGHWHQDLILKRSDKAQCWLAKTRVIGKNGRDLIFEHADNEFETTFGAPQWSK